MRKTIKIAGLVFEGVILAVLSLVVFIFVTSKLSPFGLRSIVVLTGSMEPNLPTGSIVLIKKDYGYFEGDVISFKNKSGVVVTHRVVEKIAKPDGFFFRVKGDANKSPDSDVVSESSIVGKKVFYIPYIGYISGLTKTPLGFGVFIGFPALVLIILEIINIKNEYRKQILDEVIGSFRTI